MLTDMHCGQALGEARRCHTARDAGRGEPRKVTGVNRLRSFGTNTETATYKEALCRRTNGALHRVLPELPGKQIAHEFIASEACLAMAANTASLLGSSLVSRPLDAA